MKCVAFETLCYSIKTIHLNKTMTRNVVCSNAVKVLEVFGEVGFKIAHEKSIKFRNKSDYTALINTAISLQSLSSLKIPIKSPQSKKQSSSPIKYCLSPHPSIQVWYTYTPSNSDNNSLNENQLIAQLSEVRDCFDTLFTQYDLVQSLEEIGYVYCKQHNFHTKLEKVAGRLYANKIQDQRYFDIPEMFPLARKLNRQVVIFAGETSCGKTYQALSLLKVAYSGQYLAPLRLNALETFDDLNDSEILCDLVTGDEKRIVEGARHVSSTAEIASFDRELGAVVVDEAQYMDDQERGWAFCNALIGAPSKNVLVTCPEYAIEKVSRLAHILGDEVKVVRLPRKTKLTATNEPCLHYHGLQKSSAIIAFSRKRIFQLKSQLEAHYKISVIYGGMPPEVRREQARRFREGETELLIATDAVGVGLNLPIRHIVLDSCTKFDGKTVRSLTQAEVLQVVGRAGRYKIFDEGFVSGTNVFDHSYIKECLGKPNQTTMGDKYYAKIPFSHVRDYMRVSGEKNISTALKLVHSMTRYDKELYELAPIDQVLQNLRLIEANSIALELEDIWRISHIPIDLELVEETFLDCLLTVSGISKPIGLDTSAINAHYIDDGDKLIRLESLSVQIDCISWFLLRYESCFDINLVGDITTLRKRVNTAMNNAVMKV